MDGMIGHARGADELAENVTSTERRPMTAAERNRLQRTQQAEVALMDGADAGRKVKVEVAAKAGKQR
jgi:hypothetical protein